MGASTKIVQIISDSSVGGGLATQQFPYEDEVVIVLGSLGIKVSKAGKYDYTLEMNCVMKDFHTQDAISSIKVSKEYSKL